MRLSFAVSLLASVGMMFSQAATTNTTKPSIVLVHGALSDGSTWYEVITRLQARNYNEIWAVGQPLSSITDDIAMVNDALDWIPGPIVLVGHSFGGMVISNAGNHPKVKALVYVSAFTPDEGESVASMYQSQNFTAMPSSTAHRTDSKGRFFLPPAAWAKYMSPNLPRARSNMLAAAQTLSDLGRFEWKSGPAAWRNKRTYAIISGRDQMINPDMLAWGAERINATKVVSLPKADHAIPFTAPRQVTRLIVEAAQAVARDN